MGEQYPDKPSDPEETIEVPRRTYTRRRRVGAGIVYRLVDTPRVGLTGNPDVDDGVRAALIAKYGTKEQKAD